MGCKDFRVRKEYFEVKIFFIICVILVSCSIFLSFSLVIFEIEIFIIIGFGGGLNRFYMCVCIKFFVCDKWCLLVFCYFFMGWEGRK